MDQAEQDRAARNTELRARKVTVARELFGLPEERVRQLLLHRAIAGLPRDAHARFLLPRLEVEACDRVGTDLVRIALKNGRTFFGHRSEQTEYVLHFLLRSALASEVSGDAYKLAMDIHSRYVEGTLPWWFGPRGVYIEGGCFTGLKAMKWHDALPEGSKVLAVEIGGPNHEVLRMNVEANDVGHAVVPVHAGLWSTSGEGVQHHDFTTKRFLQETDRWKDHFVHTEPVRLLTIDDLLDEHGVDVAEYLNVQVNGAEIDVLRGVKDLDRVKVIDVAAYYSRDGRRNVDVVREMLVARGCQVLGESKAGRIALVTPAHAEEVLARQPAPRR